MSTRTQPEPAEAPIEAVLQAMADNYSASRAAHQWDHLDTVACVRAAKEIRGLRAALATPSPQPAATKGAEGEALQLRSWIDTAIEAITDGGTGSKATALSALRKAQAAAVDEMTVEEAQAIHSNPLVRSRMLRYAERLNDWTANELVKAIAAAIATQEGGDEHRSHP